MMYDCYQFFLVQAKGKKYPCPGIITCRQNDIFECKQVR